MTTRGVRRFRGTVPLYLHHTVFTSFMTRMTQEGLTANQLVMKLLEATWQNPWGGIVPVPPSERTPSASSGRCPEVS